MGKVFLQYLDSPKGVYACKTCMRRGETVHLAAVDEVISHAFHSRNGPAYLFSSAVNVSFGPQEERQMTTGMHLVQDTHCVSCGEVVGWYYVKAYEQRERYKETKHILERSCIEVEQPKRESSMLLGSSASSSGGSTSFDFYE